MSLKEHRLLPSIRSDDQPSDTPFLPIDIYLDHIRSAHNVGSIIRTTEALRLGSIYVPPIMTQLSSKKMQDTAMGTLDKVPYHIVEDISSLRTPLIALETSDEALSLYDYIFPKSFSLLLGNEEYGLSQNSLAKADIFLQIPLYGFKNSLNVACAFSIVAGEIRRQLS
jgi:tRNA G18 (ribose-2'-O)-methylase SpoU